MRIERTSGRAGEMMREESSRWSERWVEERGWALAVRRLPYCGDSGSVKGDALPGW